MQLVLPATGAKESASAIFSQLAAKDQAATDNIATVEYLADPMAAGVSFYVSALDVNHFPGSQKQALEKRISFYLDDSDVTNKPEDVVNATMDYNTWMHPKMFKVVLQEGVAFKLDWKNINKERTLTVYLPKGYLLRLNYACFWRPADIKNLSGILDMMGMNTLTDAIGQNIVKGQHWLFSPWRTITFVHAVQQPLTKIQNFSMIETLSTTNKNNQSKPVSQPLPSGILGKEIGLPNKQKTVSLPLLPYLNYIASQRAFENTFAILNLNADIHAASTGLIEVQASWQDPIDTGSTALENGFEWIHQTATVYHGATGYNDYSCVFGEVSDDVRIKTPLQKITNKISKKAAIRHHFNDTKHRWINYRIVASTRYKEYFFQLINSKNTALNADKADAFNITRDSNRKRVNILSSTRPPAPQVAYVIPTFQWMDATETGDGHLKSRTRIGNLRVYLKRPWYCSGEGEKLAVILLKEPFEPKSADHNPVYQLLESIFTTWGNDPTKLVPGAGGVFPTTAHFAVADTTKDGTLYAEENLSIEMPGSPKVNIAAYDVHYDKSKQLYYADIRFNYDPKTFFLSYFPFVRLALAAYQQHAVRTNNGEDCCLSKIVKADYIQVPPARRTAVKTGNGEVWVAIAGFVSHATPNFSTHIEFVLELANETNGKSNDVILTLDEKDSIRITHTLSGEDIKDNLAFEYAHVFSLPLMFVVNSYRVKIFEYESINPFGSDGLPKAEDFTISRMKRMVFADVYEIEVTAPVFTPI